MMSRMRRLKKEKIKATMSGLALMIAIGVAGGVGSYAYFTDQAEANNDLVVTMGNVDINIPSPEIDNTVYYEKNKEEEKTQRIYIDNNGTLSQNVKLTIDNFKVNGSINDKVLKDISYKLEMRYHDEDGKDTNQIVYIDGVDLSSGGTLYDLNGKSGYLTDNKGNLISLRKQTYINCILTTNISNSNKETIQNKTITFDTKVDGIQLGGIK